MESLRQPALVLVALKTFYSKICLIELNSMDTMVRQEEVKHMKKELQLKKESLEEHERGDLRGQLLCLLQTFQQRSKGFFRRQDSPL